MTLGGIGMLLDMPKAAVIFWAAVFLQVLWIFITKGV